LGKKASLLERRGNNKRKTAWNITKKHKEKRFEIGNIRWMERGAGTLQI